MRRRLPPLNPLRAFEAAARHESFTRAAEEEGVTQAAISRQVAALEGALKLRLFERRHTALHLTESGRRYLRVVRQAFDLIETATEQLAGGGQGRPLRIRSYTTFSAHWLIPRLPGFASAHPEIDVNLTTSVAPAAFENDDADVSIRFGDGNWPGLTTTLLLPDDLAPVCSPRLIERSQTPWRPQDLHHLPLLHSRYRRKDWSDWLAFVGLDDIPAGPVFDSSTLTYQVAKQGIGIAMGQVTLLDRELRSGELVMPFTPVLRRALGYFLVHGPGALRDPRVRLFRDWLTAQADGTSPLAQP